MCIFPYIFYLHRNYNVNDKYISGIINDYVSFDLPITPTQKSFKSIFTIIVHLLKLSFLPSTFTILVSK